MSKGPYTYEAMFLLEPAAASNDWTSVANEIQKTLKKHKADPISLDKWGERKLAYAVRRQQRGVYALGYFTAPADALKDIRADWGLSEIILRVFVARHVGEIKKYDVPVDFEKTYVPPEPSMTPHGRPS